MGSVVGDMLDGYARVHGGGRTFDFSQGSAFKVADDREWSTPGGTFRDQGKMYKMVLRNGQPMSGVCATICAFWIVFHSAQDTGKGASFTRGRSIWDYLFNQGGLNMGAAQNITAEHLQSTGDQIAYFETFLKKFSIKRRTKSMAGATLSRNFVPFSNTTVGQCAREITGVGGYKLIQLKKSLDGSGSGHMVTAWCDGGDVLFMDPNLGEYWLPNKQAFHAWLTMFRSQTYNAYKSLRVHDFV